MTPSGCTPRALEREDADACDAIVASLPYHFGLDAGRADGARAVRDRALVERTRRSYGRNGFVPVWEPAGWWDAENQAVLMIRPLSPPLI